MFLSYKCMSIQKTDYCNRNNSSENKTALRCAWIRSEYCLACFICCHKSCLPKFLPFEYIPLHFPLSSPIIKSKGFPVWRNSLIIQAQRALQETITWHACKYKVHKLHQTFGALVHVDDFLVVLVVIFILPVPFLSYGCDFIVLWKWRTNRRANAVLAVCQQCGPWIKLVTMYRLSTWPDR